MTEHRRVTAEESKKKLIAGLVEVRRGILETARRLPDEAQVVVYLGIWDVKDLLAHLKGWDEANRQAIGEVLEGRLPSFYAHAGGDWDGYNAMLVKLHRREDLAALLADVEGSQQLLLESLEAVDAQELEQDRGVRYKGWKVTIARLLKAEMHDEREHLRQLQDFAVGSKAHTPPVERDEN